MSDVVAITGIAAGGDGVGRLADGRAVFVPRAAPGERVELKEKSLKLRRNYARAEVGAIVAGAPARVAPPCPHYERDHCGGCQLQHLTYDAQLTAKRAIVGDALRRIGKFDIPDPEIVEATEEWRYAAKITLAVKTARGTGMTLGLQPYDRPNGVFPLADCHITDHRLMELWRELRSRLELLPPRLVKLTLRLDRDGQRHLIAETAGEPWLDADRLRAALPDGGSVICWWKPVDGAARVVAGPATGFPAVALERTNPEMDRLARRWAAEQLGDVRGAQVVSVDADEAAVDWARRRRTVIPVRFVAARAEDILPTLPPPQGVVVQPPKEGLHWNVTLRLTGDPVPHLSYVSCDPATLARDLNRLGAVYRLVSVRAFDVFPQTAGVETVAVLEAA